jgi:hypothetical protein
MRRRLSAFLRDDDGAAAIEFAGVGTLLILGAMNAVDVGRYAYTAADVNHAAQAGAEAAIVVCDLDHTPATQNCTSLQSAVTTAVQSTRLGTYVQLHGPINEGYYCRTTAGSLAYAGPVDDAPNDCSGVANRATGAEPTLYLKVNVQHIWQPLFPGMTVAQTFNPYIHRTAWMRMK